MTFLGLTDNKKLLLIFFTSNMKHLLMILILFYFVLNSRVKKLNASIETVLVIPDAWSLFLCQPYTHLVYNIMQIFSSAWSLYALCYCTFYFANKSVGAIIRARIKTIRASEEREGTRMPLQRARGQLRGARGTQAAISQSEASTRVT